MSYHTVILVGRLGRDPELRYTPSGQAVSDFTVATDRQYTNSDSQTIRETTWFKVTVWGRQAENCHNYLRKGQMVLVEGRLMPDDNGNPRIWTRQDGSPAASFEITANIVRFLSRRGEGSSSQNDSDNSEDGSEFDEIPF